METEKNCNNSERMAKLLEMRWIACYMNYDYNFLHAFHGFQNNQIQFHEKAELLCAEASARGQSLSYEQAHNRAVAASIQGWIHEFSTRYHETPEDIEYNIAEVQADVFGIADYPGRFSMTADVAFWKQE